MAARILLLSSPPLPTSSNHSFPILKNQSSLATPKKRKWEKIMAFSTNGREPTQHNGVSRRDLVFTGLSSLSLVFPSLSSSAEEDVKMASFVDNTNSYSYIYPTELPSKGFVFKWVESRKPERYSSAAPLSPDARLRIVSERVDIIDNLIISVTIGPLNSQFLKSEKSSWSAKDVADSVLADKSALRVTSTQRLAESSLLDAHSSKIDGDAYWYFEYLVRKSPTKTALESNLFRHYVASTAERDGYLYTLSASALGKQWDQMGPFLEKSVASFRLLPPTENYVPPYKDPWRFW
ncbi:PREDICTED: psbP domain-containing protein 5, chloroplastic [Ipomoea nil]|uniref:psbP domain-containing protein 5, chloroplastic n=1 Tax=Ipomoea nil TaxID=35883 RepID=UPI000900C404|nr:PREDICTED: psbP domain-containing protein 5, chloroplastic [Ipomoea nil]